MLCGQECLSRHDNGVKIAVSLRCRSWTCEECKERRRAQLIAQSIAGKPCTLITLTSRRSLQNTPIEAAKQLSHSWRQIRRTWITLHPNQKLEFIAIFERTQLGWPHLHILARSQFISQAWLSNQMRKKTNSPIVDIRHIDDPGRAAAYVAKYTSKEAAKFGTLKRYWTSKFYELEKRIKDKSKHQWERQTMTLEKWAAMWVEFEYIVTFPSRCRAEARAPP